MSLVIEKALNAVDEADAERDTALLAQDEGKAVERKQDIAAKATAMTGTTTVTDRLKEQSKQRGRKTPERAAKEAARKKAAAKAKPAAKRETGNAAPRITDEWLDAKGKDIAIGDLFKTPDGIVAKCIGRWTRRAKSGNVPCITGRITTLPTGASRDTVKGKEKKVGERVNCVAAEAVHTK